MTRRWSERARRSAPRPDMAELVDGVPAAVLAVYAHPNDPEVSCGGTLARWAAAGSEVRVVICTRGDKGSSDAAADPDALAEQRAGEVACSAAALGLAGFDLLGYDDGSLDDTESLRGELVARVRQHRPDAVVCPDPTAVFFGERYFNHRDHRIVGWVAMDAVAPAAGLPHYFPEAGPAHQVSSAYLSGTLEPNVWIDVGDFIEAKAEALLCHESQIGEPGEWLRDVVR